MKFWKAPLLLLLCSPAVAQAAASRCPAPLAPKSTVQLRQYPFAIGESATESLLLCRRVFVHKLYIQAEGYWNDAYAQVLVNGSVKGTLYVPGRDPHYVVTVEEATSSIEFVSIRSPFRILAVSAVLSENGPAPEPGFPIHTHTEMGRISARVIQLVNALEHYSNYQAYGSYLLPIRKAAAEALAIAEARGDSSLSGRASYERLLKTLDDAAPYLSDAFEIDQALNLAVELMSKRELIRRLLM